jgi:hypothetical protein
MEIDAGPFDSVTPPPPPSPSEPFVEITFGELDCLTHASLLEVIKKEVERVLTKHARSFVETLDQSGYCVYHTTTKDGLPTEVTVYHGDPTKVVVRTLLRNFKPMTFYPGKEFFYNNAKFESVLVAQLDALAICKELVDTYCPPE